MAALFELNGSANARLGVSGRDRPVRTVVTTPALAAARDAAREAGERGESAVAPLPSDFDWSGFVDAPSAGPPPGVPIDKNTDRYYRGYCVSTGELPSVIDEYRARRADMMTLINTEPHLNPQFRAKAARFIDGFFALLDDPGRVQRELIKHCR